MCYCISLLFFFLFVYIYINIPRIQVLYKRGRGPKPKKMQGNYATPVGTCLNCRVSLGANFNHMTNIQRPSKLGMHLCRHCLIKE